MWSEVITTEKFFVPLKKKLKLYNYINNKYILEIFQESENSNNNRKKKKKIFF